MTNKLTPGQLWDLADHADDAGLDILGALLRGSGDLRNEAATAGAVELPPPPAQNLVIRLRAVSMMNLHPEMTLHHEAADAIETMQSALLAALPFVEDAERDPAYKPGHVRKVAKQIRDAILAADSRAKPPQVD